MVRLEYVRSAHVFFRDETYRWLDAAQFAMSGAPVHPRAVLEALLCHGQYLDHYMKANNVAGTRLDRPLLSDQHPVASQALHGPYHAQFITPDSFDRVDSKTVRETVETWLRAAGGDPNRLVPPVEQIKGDLTALLAELEAFDDVYQLRDLPETAMHDFGFVVYPYLEIIGIDFSRNTLLLVAGGTD